MGRTENTSTGFLLCRPTVGELPTVLAASRDALRQKLTSHSGSLATGEGPRERGCEQKS
jgi:hypothetical protein